MAADGSVKRRPPLGWVSAYARHAGCDKGYVSRLVNHRGMPFDAGADRLAWTFESADRWRAAHASEGVGHKSKGFRDDTVRPAGAGLLSVSLAHEVEKVIAGGEEADGLAAQAREDAAERADDEGLAGDGSLEAMGRRAQISERRAFLALAEAYRAARMPFRDGDDGKAVAEIRLGAVSSLPGLLRTYTQASKARLDVERRVIDELARRKVVAPVDEVWISVRDAVRPLIDGLKQLPRLCGARANRENPALAEGVMTEETNVLLAKAQRIVDGGRV